MRLNNIKITTFRNLLDLETEFSEGVNIFYGNNGSGKTNLLEAVFVLCLGKSHRNAADGVMVSEDMDIYRLEGAVTTEEREYELAVAYQKGGRKKVTIDKVVCRTSELFDNFCVVSAGPEDSNIISGAPSVRRSFLDIYLSQYSQKYLQDLVNYQKILAQKNAALKNDMDASPFNDLLVTVGSSIMLTRAEYIDEISQEAVEYYSEISDGGKFTIEYKPTVKTDDVFSLESIKGAFYTALNKNSERERIMTTSLVGPHRDDLYFGINSYPARSHGSQGEWRTASLSLKIAVHNIIKSKRNMTPILLLDEVFAELDSGRSEALVGLFGNLRQCFITTALEPPGFLKENSANFKIDNGQIICVD